MRDDAPARPRADPGARVTARSLTFGPDGVTSGDAPDPPQALRSKRHRLRRVIVVSALAFALAAAPVGYLSLRTRSWRHPLDTLPATRAAIVFGAGAGQTDQNAALVEAADELRRGHIVREVLLVGPEFEGQSATATGSATPDPGARTIYEACHRANRVHSLDAAVVIATPEQLDRALYSCRQLGVAAVGVGVGDPAPVSLSRTFDSVRTIWRVHVSRPGPRYDLPGLPG